MSEVEQPRGSAPRAPLSRPKRALVLTLGTNFAVLALTVVSGTMNARLLGPGGRGELAAIQTIPSALASIAVLGLPSAVGYFTARNPREVRRLAVTGATIAVLSAIPFMCMGYLVMPHALRSQSASVIDRARLYLLFTALQGVAQMAYWGLQGLGRFGTWNVLRIAPNVAAVLAVGSAWWSGQLTAGTVATRFLFLNVCVVPIAYAALWRSSERDAAPAPPRKRAKELLRYGLPTALMGPVGMVNLQLDQMLMAAWLPSEELGLYAISVSWSGLLSPVLSALGLVIFPQLAAVTDPEMRRSLVGRSLRGAVLIVICLGIGLAAATPVLLPLLFGRSFTRAVPAALILIAAGMILSVNTVLGDILRGVGAPRWPLVSQFAALPVTVVLLVTLLPRWSLVGAGLSSLAAYLTAGIVCVMGTRMETGLSIRVMLIPTAADLSMLKTTLHQMWRRKLG